MDLATVHEFEGEIRKYIPQFKLAFKDESVFQKVIGWLSKPFNPKYMTDFCTTLGNTVYFPTKDHYETMPLRTFSILAHEFVHLMDEKSNGKWQNISYGLPQLLALPVLLLTIAGCFWKGPVALLGLVLMVVLALPWPAPWRVKWEGRGYAMTLAVSYWMFGLITDVQRQSVAKQFYGSAYYYMLWSEKSALELLAKTEAQIAMHTLETMDPYKIVFEFLNARGMVRQP